MADFSFPSERNDSAVEEILAQAMDQSTLEQVAAINCAGFSDSVLPTDLETRFRKLKSFPVTNQTQKTKKTHLPSSNSMKKEEPPTSLNPLMKKIPSSSSNEATADTQSQEQFLSSNRGKESPNSSSDGETVVSVSKKSREKKGLKSKSKSKSGSRHSSSSPSDSSEVLSPPQQKCWFWWSPKKVSRKKGKENKVEGLLLDTLDYLGKDDDELLLSDLSMFSLKEQQKKLKKALKEEEKVAREAKKIVELAKQASARMNVSFTHDVSSDDERFK